jgi:hypothetical protein
VRAWERLAAKSSSWPWKPRLLDPGGTWLGTPDNGSAVMAHDLPRPPRCETIELPE